MSEEKIAPMAIQQTRRWRQAVEDSWEGLSQEEILQNLAETGRRFQERIDARRRIREEPCLKKKAPGAPA